MTTIKDVAREAGTSIATVSYVINGKVGEVSEATRQQVMAAIARTGYRPNITARNLQSSQTKLMGYAWHDIRHGQMNPILDQFTYLLAQSAEAAGYHLLTFTHNDDNWEAVYHELIRTRRVDGFVISNTKQDDPRIAYLMRDGFPFVSFGQANPDWDFPYVDTDGAHGVYVAVNTLIGLGHKRIAMVGWPEGSLSGDARLRGYRRAMQEAALPVPSVYVQRGEQLEQTGRDALRLWRALPPADQPTAVVAVTDLIAIGVITEAKAVGIRVGHDLAVIGHDDVPLAQYLDPALTTIRQPLDAISRAVVAMLHPLIAGEPLAYRRDLVVPQLILRQSHG
ncbi:MAG: LacI family DNA-binding transcriptional regulator [Anaerolineae bacterium]|jgi:DNA-binding LacI/PurR family transcriptional regulator|nr:LacI family DNA-binding transcriptional regulator [Anaerolineae bacterium]